MLLWYLIFLIFMKNALCAQTHEVGLVRYVGKQVRLTAACKAHVCPTQPRREHEILCRCATVGEVDQRLFPPESTGSLLSAFAVARKADGESVAKQWELIRGPPCPGVSPTRNIGSVI